MSFDRILSEAGQLLRLHRPDGSGCFLAHSPAHATAGMVVAFAVPRAGGGVVGGGSGQGGARVESSNHIAPHCGC